MKLPIEFRGIDSDTGYYLYGDLIHDGEQVFILDPFYGEHEVKPKSVAQLVGYDADGKEIYSDDKIRVYDHSRYCMAGTGIEIAGDFIKVNDIGKTFDNVELLEEAEKNGNDI